MKDVPALKTKNETERQGKGYFLREQSFCDHVPFSLVLGYENLNPFD